MQAVWGDVAVTDESITKCIAEIRKALADDSQEIVRTVTRRGFLFQAEVRLVPPTAASDEQQIPPRIGGRRTMLIAGTVVFVLVVGLAWLRWRWHLFGRKPAFEAIAVLPFESLSNSADQQYLGDGMTETLITSLGQASPFGSLRGLRSTSISGP